MTQYCAVIIQNCDPILCLNHPKVCAIHPKCCAIVPKLCPKIVRSVIQSCAPQLCDRSSKVLNWVFNVLPQNFGAKLWGKTLENRYPQLWAKIVKHLYTDARRLHNRPVRPPFSVLGSCTTPLICCMPFRRKGRTMFSPRTLSNKAKFFNALRTLRTFRDLSEVTFHHYPPHNGLHSRV